MRAVGVCDLDLMARVLLAHPRACWASLAREMIEDAHVADKWRKRKGRPHPAGGTGSLYAQASLYPRSTSGRAHRDYCRALNCATGAVIAWRDRGASGAISGRDGTHHRFNL